MGEQVINPMDNPGQNPETPLENGVPTVAAAEEWQKKHDEVKEKLLWMTADFENYKKRALKDKEDHLKFSQAGLLQEVLVVADNLERALAALPADDKDKGLLSLKQGVDLTLKQFNSILAKYNVTKIKAKGEKFDPRMHEVMFQEETTEFPDGTVLDELQSGYLLHDRVLRPAMVKIAKNL
jgi:molecular chaperone GrpE